MTIFKPRDGEVDSFHITQNLNVNTNAKARTNQRAESVNKFDRFANIARGLDETGKQKLSGTPSAKELNHARKDKEENYESRRKSTRSKKG